MLKIGGTKMTECKPNAETPSLLPYSLPSLNLQTQAFNFLAGDWKTLLCEIWVDQEEIDIEDTDFDVRQQMAQPYSLDSVIHNQQVPPMGSELTISVLGPYSWIWPPESWEKRKDSTVKDWNSNKLIGGGKKKQRENRDFEGRRKCQWKRLS